MLEFDTGICCGELPIGLGVVSRAVTLIFAIPHPDGEAIRNSPHRTGIFTCAFPKSTWQDQVMDDFAIDASTEAMCKAWRLFRDHGEDAESIVDGELARCIQAGNRDGAGSRGVFVDAIEA